MLIGALRPAQPGPDPGLGSDGHTSCWGVSDSHLQACAGAV